MKLYSSSCGIELDFSNACAGRIGYAGGITEDDLNSVRQKAQAAHSAVEKVRAEGTLGFLKLPYTDPKLVQEIKHLAADIERNYSDFVVLGIGGSALGNIAVHSALNHPFYNNVPGESHPRLFVLDNVDPEYISAVMDMLPLEKTCFNVITKSGTTAETMSQFLLFRQLIIDRLGYDAFKKQVVATTDPSSGVLRKIANDEGLRTLPIPPDVGGRFSVLTAVGLLSAAVTGINISDLLEGARLMDEECRKPEMTENPAVMNAVVQYIMDTIKMRPMAVMMPYVQSLRDFADWFRQLLAESIGKKFDRDGNVVHVGTTPIKALGATDQHSQIQLYMEGPEDKFITFLGVKKYRTDLTIPAAYTEIEKLSFLANKTFSRLIHAEQQATSEALANNGRPNCTITLDEISAKSIGALLYLFEYQIAIAGELYNINAFDQPGVEEGKILTYQKMTC
ncbi:MAG: glucose-6-phosphate isomerase [Candidatus Auribacter fodinae]|jgi:glucose-6-phosphate isomerase|uniref:Glucose-6-phosphate isomerase n=1 Tax=Candidatus Auribacter fodinae TaxID=2093366 RepID=A0A3A4RAN3_9BACT|nr:MAG: glucose-6-phosphate isomerase [Candidatus Auribacter fodinae]